MKESPLSRTALTAKEAVKLTAAARKYGAQIKADDILKAIYAKIREQASIGSTSLCYDLLGEGGLKGLPLAKEKREIVTETLVEQGYQTQARDHYHPWLLQIVWEGK